MAAASKPTNLLSCIALVCVSLALTASGHASDDLDHETARTLRLEGKILPLATILSRMEALDLTTVLELELEREDDRLIYEVEALDQRNRVVEVYIDASTGELLKFETDDRD
jgi:uncharacterized membrane protein YkoI